MSTYRYAAYGSNLHPYRLQKRVSSARLLGVSFNSKFELKFNKKSNVDGSGKCNISVGDEGVYLAIYEIARSQKAILDRIEGLGNGYNEISICDVEFGDCLSYIADPSAIDNAIRPIDWYKEMVLLGCRIHCFPKEYVNAIEILESIEDRDKNRSRAQWKMVEDLRNGV